MIGSKFPKQVSSSVALVHRAGLLRPGVWQFIRQEGDTIVLRHQHAGPPPDALADLIPNSRKGKLVLFPRTRMPPTLVDGFSADWMLLRSRTVLAVDSTSRNVARVNSAPYVSLDYELYRERFSLHVPSVPFSVIPGRIGIIEEFVDGTKPALLEEEDRTRVSLSLLNSLTQVVIHEQAQEAGQLLTRVCPTSPLSAARTLGKDIIRTFGDWPLVPTHADLGGDNILVSSEGPTVIDFGNLRPGLPVEDTLRLYHVLGNDGLYSREDLLEVCAKAASVKPCFGDNFFRLLSVATAALSLAAMGGISPDRIKKTYAKWDRNVGSE